jgi:hypothetical protein
MGADCYRTDDVDFLGNPVPVAVYQEAISSVGLQFSLLMIPVALWAEDQEKKRLSK